MVQGEVVVARVGRGVRASLRRQTGPDDRADLLVPDLRIGDVDAEAPLPRPAEVLRDLVLDLHAIRSAEERDAAHVGERRGARRAKRHRDRTGVLERERPGSRAEVVHAEPARRADELAVAEPLVDETRDGAARRERQAIGTRSPSRPSSRSRSGRPGTSGRLPPGSRRPCSRPTGCSEPRRGDTAGRRSSPPGSEPPSRS